jgi:seryl-tRNA synthetase
MTVAVAGQAQGTNNEGRQASLADALFRPTGVPGVYGRTQLYEDIIDRLSNWISGYRTPGTEVLRFPPVMSRRDLEKAGYLKSFPNLLGCVCALHGSEAEIHAAVRQFDAGGDWTPFTSATDLVLSPAACYPIYPLVARRGTAVPVGGLGFDVASDCYRREPSGDLDRLQTFRMREYVCIGSRQDVTAFRDGWKERGQALADDLALPCRIAPASDPFFGRTGQMIAVGQIQQALKFELLVPLHSDERPTACMSFNYHRDHFGTTFGIRDHAGVAAHTACVAFGMDRLAVALFWTHGLDTKAWPASARLALAL